MTTLHIDMNQQSNNEPIELMSFSNDTCVVGDGACTNPMINRMTDRKQLAGLIVVSGMKIRESAHLSHLKFVGGYAAHKDLEIFYSELTDLLDTFAESFSGRYEIIDQYPLVLTNGLSLEDPIEYISSYRSLIDISRSRCELSSELCNALDNIVELCNLTLNRLRHGRGLC